MARTTRLNDAQLKLIQMFEFANTPEEEKQLMQVLQDFYVQKFNDARKRVMASGNFSAAVVDEYVRTHHHGKLIQ